MRGRGGGISSWPHMLSDQCTLQPMPKSRTQESSTLLHRFGPRWRNFNEKFRNIPYTKTRARKFSLLWKSGFLFVVKHSLLHINEKIPRMPRSWNLVQFVLKMNCKAKMTSSIGKFLRRFSRKFDAHMIKMWRMEYSALCYRKLAFMRKHGLNMYSTEKFKSV